VRRRIVVFDCAEWRTLHRDVWWFCCSVMRIEETRIEKTTMF
jgi:hypothetical protein